MAGASADHAVARRRAREARRLEPPRRCRANRLGGVRSRARGVAAVADHADRLPRRAAPADRRAPERLRLDAVARGRSDAVAAAAFVPDRAAREPLGALAARLRWYRCLCPAEADATGIRPRLRRVRTARREAGSG